jgi:hypothetical protein
MGDLKTDITTSQCRVIQPQDPSAISQKFHGTVLLSTQLITMGIWNNL